MKKRAKSKIFRYDFLKKDRKGIMSSQLVKIILLVVGFTILLLVFSTLLNEDEIDREVCHASVIARGALPDAFNLKDIAALKCKTEKFCITDKTSGDGDCESEQGFEKGDYETISVSKDKTEEDINRFVARELASCWAMMGKGESQIFTQKITTEKRCSICSRIAFDKDLKGKLNNKVEGLGNYLVSREVPNQGISYWRYLTNDLSSENYNKNLDGFSTEQKAIVFIEIGNLKAWSWLFQIVEGAGWGAIGVKTGSVIGSIFGPFGMVAGGTIGGFTGIVFGWVDGGKVGDLIEEKKFISGHAFGDYKGDALKELECSSFESIS